MNIMYAFDSAMAIFSNIPPRISFAELDLQLPCDSIYFELSSYSDMLNHATFPKPRIKLIDAFRKLFVPTTELSAAIERDSLNCWDMMFLVHCLYTHVWRQTFWNPLLRSSPSTLHAPSNILEPLKTAIRNWKVIWDNIRKRLTRDQMRDMGFETSADSYWTLTKLIVHRFDPKSNANPHETSHSTSSLSYPSGTTVNLGGMRLTVKDGHTSALTGVPAGYASSCFSSATAAGITDFGPDYSASMGGQGGAFSPLDFMPLETDCDSQGVHLRKILRRAR